MKMTHTQKKWLSFTTAVLLVTLFSLLTGCNKADEEQKKKDEATTQFMHQGNGTVRKPGQSGFKAF